MIETPERQIAEFAKAGADSITFHEEATPHANRTLHAIRELGCLAGVAINPGTPVEARRRAARLRRHRPLHDGQPRLGRAVLHRVLARTRSSAWRRWSARRGSRSTAASTPAPPARSPPPAPPSSSPAPPSSAPHDPAARLRARSPAAAGASRSAQPVAAAINAPVTSCHQARSAASTPGAAGATLAPARQRPAAADRDDLGAGHRVAAVGEGQQRAGAVAAAAQHRQHRDAVDLARLGRVLARRAPGAR